MEDKYEKCFKKLIELLNDHGFITRKNFNVNTVKGILSLTEQLEQFKGELPEGRRTIDCYTMPDCPKHRVAPLYMCLECEYLKGKRIDLGYCNAPTDKLFPEELKYSRQ